MKTVIIHGKKISDLSPRHGRPECALWTVTRAIARFWRGVDIGWTEHFDNHPLTKTDRFEGIPTRRPDAWAWYCAQDGTRPIYLQAPEDHHPDDQKEALRLFNMVPGARRFPMRELQARFPMKTGTYPTIVEEPNRYFVEMTGQIICKAIAEGYECIILNGIGTIMTLEHQTTHRSILYWMAEARARGIAVLLEGPSYLKTPTEVYAYGKFNYQELDEARAESKRIAERPRWIGLEDENRRQRARGRPMRHKIPRGAFGAPE